LVKLGDDPPGLKWETNKSTSRHTKKSCRGGGLTYNGVGFVDTNRGGESTFNIKKTRVFQEGEEDTLVGRRPDIEYLTVTI